MSISASVRLCLDAFQATRNNEPLNSAHKAFVNDQQGRFRVWTGNVSAHRTGHRSLEYRLRDSPDLESTAKALLKDLLTAVDQVPASFISRDVSGQVDLLADSPKPDDSDEDSLLSLNDEEGSSTDVTGQAFDEIKDVVDDLMRFSMTLRHPLRREVSNDAGINMAKYSYKYDVEHVSQKYPNAPDYLVKRLGQAISGHRRYCTYRDQRHQKFIEGLDEKSVPEQESTVATSLQRLNNKVTNIDALDDVSEYSATSFATTVAADVGLRPPPLLHSGQTGDPFECPVCYGIIVATNERAWRQHLYEDIPPYYCTHAECLTASQAYSRRRDWQNHERRLHNRSWTCPFSCMQTFFSLPEFESHMVRRHGQTNELAAMDRLADACASSEIQYNNVRQCPLCQQQYTGVKPFFKHVGHHLEQLALFSLPQHLFSETPEDEPQQLSGRELLEEDEDESEVDSHGSMTGMVTHVHREEASGISQAMSGNHTLQDDQARLMLEKEQWKQRLLMLDQEPGSKAYRGMPGDGPEGQVPSSPPQSVSPASHIRADGTLPSASNMRGTPKMNKSMSPNADVAGRDPRVKAAVDAEDHEEARALPTDDQGDSDVDQDFELRRLAAEYLEGGSEETEHGLDGPRSSRIPRSIPQQLDEETGASVSELAKHFEQMSREFEKERLEERRTRVNPLASSRPVLASSSNATSSRSSPKGDEAEPVERQNREQESGEQDPDEAQRHLAGADESERQRIIADRNEEKGRKTSEDTEAEHTPADDEEKYPQVITDGRDIAIELFTMLEREREERDSAEEAAA